MSVLIKGMEMPKPFDHLFVGENLAGDLFVRNDTQEGDDVVWYPLVEIPPHGRLIDADALIDKVIAKYLKFERKGKLVFAAAEIKQDICDLISDAPTIIPASGGKNMKIRVYETVIEADARELRESNTLASNFAALLSRCFQNTEPFDDDYDVSDDAEDKEG